LFVKIEIIKNRCDPVRSLQYIKLVKKEKYTFTVKQFEQYKFKDEKRFKI